ncbi:AmmeMemoRadiSam system radical SAM enzyme [bacterium]|nr:AmmeMemoRadiSam system radical SAM enzyme [bacterium]
MKEGTCYKKLDEGRVQCLICPHECVLSDGQEGICMGHQNLEGKLIATNYGQLVTVSSDPIEKKPLYHFHPGKDIVSIGANGCNFRCSFCQNWHISQKKCPTEKVFPENLIMLTMNSGSIGIAYTYTEPTIWYEYVYDCAKLAHEKGLVNVLVSNGFINPEPLRNLLPYIDAMNIDLKSMDPEFYKKYCQGKLEPVLDTIKIASAETHVEVTNLVIESLNDSDELIGKLVTFIKELNKPVPLHFSRYYPTYKMNVPATSPERLFEIYEFASEHLPYVYVGNVWDTKRNTTYCPQCKNELIRRDGFRASITGIVENKCSNCGREVDIVGL